MAKKLWGGRFTKPTDTVFEAFSRSIHYDSVLAEYDVIHSLLHVTALREAELLNKDEAAILLRALDTLLDEVRSGKFIPDADEEDIHSAVQNRLEQSVGKPALKLHTLRSRNDQIAFDVKYYCFTKALHSAELLRKLVQAFETYAKEHSLTPFIGYTHTQRAQIISFGDYMLAYASMFGRDRKRVLGFLDHLDIRIGAGALAGSSIPYTAYEQAVKDFDPDGKPRIIAVENAPEHVADRDFVIEFLSVLSILQMHLSRFAEDMILYSTAEFDYLDLPEEFCTGSSLMPHKKNADLMELLRGYTGTIYGNLVSLLVTMKGLPLTYNRDMQLDKEPLFAGVEVLEKELDMLTRFVPGIRLKREKIDRALEDEHLYGVEIAEYLVNNGLPFKEAHEVTGKLIRYSEDHDLLIKDIPAEILNGFHRSLSPGALREIMTPEYALRQKRSVKRT